NGEIKWKKMKHRHDSKDDSEEELRLDAKTEDVSSIELARLERSGDISFIKKKKSGQSVGSWTLARRSRAEEGFPNAVPRQAFHSRPGRSLAQNLGRFLEADDRPSRRSFPRALPRHSSASSDFVRNQTAGLSFYLLSLG